MTSVEVKSVDGKKTGSATLDSHWFGVQPNVPVMHQVVTAQLAHRRAGTQATKTRAEVRGGGRKPWRQKGTGRARAGSSRSPIWVGGGVALGPQPRSYSQKTPKKMISLALRSALSDRASSGRIVVIDDFGWETPSTKSAVKALEKLGCDGRVLVVLDPDIEAHHNYALAFRNLGTVQVIARGELNAYDVLCNDWLVFTTETLPGTEAAKSEEPAKAAAKPATKKADDGAAGAADAADADEKAEDK